MPYRLEGNCVHKVGEDKPLKCYSNHADALAYLRALEANVTDAKENKAYNGLLSQEETAYVTVSTSRGKMCANCRWFQNYEDRCHIVYDLPEPILATGYCNRWETIPEPVTPDIAPVPVVIVEPPEMEMEMARKPKGIVERIKEVFTGSKDAPEFEVFKDDAGEWHWHATYTNNYEDLEGEILSQKAHDKFIGRLDMGLIPMPELWCWHTFGTKHGQAKLIWRNEHFIHAVGDFEDTPDAKAAIEYYRWRHA